MPFKKILAIKIRSLGDTVLMTAPLNELRAAYPDASIHVVVMSKWAPILEKHPAINKVWTYERHKEPTSRAKAVARLSLKLRRERFDCVVNFHASPSSSIIAFATGAKTRSIHFHGHRDRNRYSTVIVPGKGTLKPIIERDMDAVRALGLKIPEGRMPDLFLKPAEQNEAAMFFSKSGIKGPILGVGLGASRPTKSWPIGKFAQTAANWHQKTGGGIAVFTGPGEETLAQTFVDSLSALDPQAAKQVTLQSQLSVREMAARISRMSVFLGNDSGPKHVAVALQVPTVTLFGPEHPFEWHPYPKDRHPYFFIESLECRKDALPGMPPWCGVNECVAEQHRCMTSIDATQVLGECERVARR